MTTRGGLRAVVRLRRAQRRHVRRRPLPGHPGDQLRIDPIVGALASTSGCAPRSRTMASARGRACPGDNGLRRPATRPSADGTASAGPCAEAPRASVSWWLTASSIATERDQLRSSVRASFVFLHRRGDEHAGRRDEHGKRQRRACRSTPVRRRRPARHAAPACRPTAAAAPCSRGAAACGSSTRRSPTRGPARMIPEREQRRGGERRRDNLASHGRRGEERAGSATPAVRAERDATD